MKQKLTLLFIFSLFFLSCSSLPAQSGEEVSLWTGTKNKANVSMFHHKTRSGDHASPHPAVIILPGGSYHHLGIYNEGYLVAKYFNSEGVDAFSLHYRTAEAGDHYPAMLEDAERAIELVRENAEEWGIDAEKVGVAGFSAGGHLALMAGAFAESHNELVKFGLGVSVSLRPSFVVACYPVVSMVGNIAHEWSVKSLLTEDATHEERLEFSMERRMTTSMSPTYIVVCRDDWVVDPWNSFLLSEALKRAGVEHYFAVYDKGGHGFGTMNGRFLKKTKWNEKMISWLKEKELL